MNNKKIMYEIFKSARKEKEIRLDSCLFYRSSYPWVHMEKKKASALEDKIKFCLKNCSESREDKMLHGQSEEPIRSSTQSY